MCQKDQKTKKHKPTLSEYYYYKSIMELHKIYGFPLDYIWWNHY